VELGTHHSAAHHAGDRPLSAREHEVLALAAAGLTNHEMAAQLHLSVHGIKFHLASIYRKLGVSNRTEAAVHFLRTSPPGSESQGS
jgi:DNA-binding CsgD family transcriptional regulator